MFKIKVLLDSDRRITNCPNDCGIVRTIVHGKSIVHEIVRELQMLETCPKCGIRIFQVSQFLAKYRAGMLPVPWCALDLSPSSSYLLSQLKCSLKGYRLDTVANLEKNIIRILNRSSSLRLTSGYHRVVGNQWKSR